MQWYYAHLGDTDNRGIVEQDELFEMARQGKLAPSDLVWNQEKDDGWVPASTVHGLFPEQPETKNVSAEKEIEIAPQPEAVTKQDQQKSSNILPILLVLATFMTFAVIYTMKKEANSEEKNANIAQETLQADLDAEIAHSNQIVKLLKEMNSALNTDDHTKASSILAELIDLNLESNNTAELTYRIDNLDAELAQIDILWESLYKGTITDKSAKTLIKLYDSRGGNKRVLGFIKNMMTNSTTTISAHISLARMFNALKYPKEAETALDNFIEKADFKGGEKIYIDASHILETQGRKELAIELLQRYTENHPTNSRTWLELAAIQASGNTPKDAYDSIENAIKYGNNDTKQAASQDARFDSIKDKRKFKRLIKQ